MSDPYPSRRYDRYEPGRAAPPSAQPSSLADVLDRVLDKGLVIAGDISISLARVELLTIKIRLLVASVERAREMGIDWWSRDESLSGGGQQELPSGTQEELEQKDPEELAEMNRALAERVQELESKLSGLLSEQESVATKSSAMNVGDFLAMREGPSGGGPAGGGAAEGAEEAEGEEGGSEEAGPEAGEVAPEDAGPSDDQADEAHEPEE